MKKRIVILLFMCFLFVGFLKSATLDKDTLYLPMSTDPGTLDPNQATGVWERDIIDNIFTGLFELDVNGKAKKALVDSYTVSNDGKTYTFKLKNTVWNDGKPLTAHDFVFSYERILNPKNASKYAAALYPIAGAEDYNNWKITDFNKVGVKALDNNTLQIKLHSAEAFFIERLVHYTYYAIPAHVVQKHGKDWVKVNNIVGNGAYKIVEWKPQTVIRLVRNDKFYENNLTKINNVVFAFKGKEADLEYKSFLAGEIDITMFDPSKVNIDDLKNQFKDQLYIFPEQTQSYLSINAVKPSNKALLNPEIRKALMYALDSGLVIKRVRGLNLPATSMIPPSMGSYTPVRGFWADLTTAQRVAESKKLMEKNGYNEKKRLKINYYYMNSKASLEIATLIRDLFKQVYIDLQLVPFEVIAFYDEIAKKNHDIALTAWGADYNDASTFFYIMMSGVENNYSGYSNPELDKLVKAGMVELDEKKRNALYTKAEQIAQADLFYLPYAFTTGRKIVSKRVLNWKPNANDHNLIRWLDLAK